MNVTRPLWVWIVVIGFAWLTGYLMGTVAAGRKPRSRLKDVQVPATPIEKRRWEFAPGYDVLAEEAAIRNVVLREKAG